MAVAAAVSGDGEEGAPALALAAFKVAVAGADGVLPRFELVAVHGDAHRAAGFAPLCAGFLENPVEAFGFSLFLDILRTGHDHHAQSTGHFAPFQQRSRQAQVGDARVGAGADEDHIHLLAEQGLPGLQAHVGQGFFEGEFLAGIAERGRDRVRVR